MGNNILWLDTHRRPWLDKPFLAYVGYKEFAQFGDWLYGETSRTDIRGVNFHQMYGYFRPDNFIKRALKFSRGDRIMRGEMDQKALRLLRDFRSQLLAQETRLYKDLGCKDFFEFRNLWEGKAFSNQQGTLKEKQNYWLNYHISLLSGETQRLATEKDWTQIEQILALVAIELDKVDITGIEGIDGFGKKELKEELKEANILTIPDKEIIFRSTGKGINVYIPSKEYNKLGDKEFAEVLRNFYLQACGKTISETLANGISESLDKSIAYALGQVQTKLVRKKEVLGTKTIDAGFVSMNFSVLKNKTMGQSVANRVYKFMERARIFDLTEDEFKNWQEDNKNGEMERFIKEKIEELCEEYLKNRDPLDINPRRSSEVMGFFGELAAFAKGHFNLKQLANDKRQIDIFDIGGFRSVKSGQQLASDTVIVVKGKSYGIQVKNPYQVTDNQYKTYSKKLSFDSDKTIEELKNFFDFDDQQLALFEMYNLNINNTTNPEYYKQLLQQFLLLHSGKFARLDGEEIRDDLSKYQNPVLQSLQGKSINNVFFILKGTIYPSSYILQGLIEQYYFLLENWNKYQKRSIAQKTLVFNYTNNIEKNLIGNKDDEGKPFDQVGSQYINTDIESLLKKIKITSYLKLEIPSIIDLMSLDKKR